MVFVPLLKEPAFRGYTKVPSVSKFMLSPVWFAHNHLKFYFYTSFHWCEQTTLRVWDVLFNEGAKVLFHVALAIFKVPHEASYILHVSWLPSLYQVKITFPFTLLMSTKFADARRWSTTHPTYRWCDWYFANNHTSSIWPWWTPDSKSSWLLFHSSILCWYIHNLWENSSMPLKFKPIAIEKYNFSWVPLVLFFSSPLCHLGGCWPHLSAYSPIN